MCAGSDYKPQCMQGTSLMENVPLITENRAESLALSAAVHAGNTLRPVFFFSGRMETGGLSEPRNTDV